MPRTKKTIEATIEERQLFPHQLESVYLMEKFEAGKETIEDPDTGFFIKSSYGCLSNPVGSGKTTVMLQVIKNDKLKFETLDTITFSIGGGLITGDPRTLYTIDNTNEVTTPGRRFYLRCIPVSVVVCSKPLTTVWQKEAQVMNVPHMIINTPKHVDFDTFTDKYNELITHSNGVIIISSQLYGDTMSNILQITNLKNDYTIHMTFKRFVFDDFHSVTKMNAFYGKLCALFTWNINTTPESVYWSRYNRSLGRIITIDTTKQYTLHPMIPHIVKVPIPPEVYNQPEIVVHRHFFKPNELSNVLLDHIPFEVKQMLDTGNYEEAYKIMYKYVNPAEEGEEDENIMANVASRIPIHELVGNKYKQQIEKLKQRKIQLIEMGGSTKNVDDAIKEEERKLDNLHERLREAESENCDCPICYDTLERGEMVITKCCNNLFCKKCIQEAVFNTNKICPLCRAKITPLSLYTLRNDNSAFDVSEIVNMKPKNSNISVAKSPMEALLNLATSKPNGSKFVVFAPFEGSSKTFKTFFKDTPYQVVDLSGSAASIKNKLESFENGSVQILFLSHKTSNAGLNLQFATDVVIIDNNATMNENGDDYKQSVGRVRRFPRTAPVPVHFISSC